MTAAEAISEGVLLLFGAELAPAMVHFGQVNARQPLDQAGVAAAARELAAVLRRWQPLGVRAADLAGRAFTPAVWEAVLSTTWHLAGWLGGEGATVRERAARAAVLELARLLGPAPAEMN